MSNDDCRMTNDKTENLKDRTKRFAVETIRLCASLPKTQEFKIVGGQLMRSASSVGANYRAACRARSIADFVAKLSIVEEEADESVYWMEVLEGLGMAEDAALNRLKNEADQLVAIVVASKKTAKKRIRNVE
jgi:four helix bundle protein